MTTDPDPAGPAAYDPDEVLYGVTDRGSPWARCACCGFEGFRFPNGLCGTCQYDDHQQCHLRHRRTRPTGWHSL